MMELAGIRPYVEKMAYIMSIILEMDVIISDSHLQVVGDWEHKGTVSSEMECLKTDSVISKAIRENRIVIYNDAKKESAGCLSCSKRSSCRTETIIACPLSYKDEVIGGMGIYSQEKQQKDKLITQKDPMVDFIDRMGELLINQLEKETVNVETLAENQKMNRIVESLDFALASIDEDNRILYYNERFRRLVGKSGSLKERNISELLDGFTAGGRKEKTSRIFLGGKNCQVEYEMTYSPVLIEGQYTGALIYLKEAAELLARANELLEPVKQGAFDEIIGSSPQIIKAKEDTENFARSFSNILIQGESGTGKELFAAAIHNASRCAKGPFVAVNCAAIPDNLLESELFGYEEGAFTGAAKGGRAGKFEIANKGTLFLDEIGELPIHLQPKLLRALQERKIQRVGSSRSIDIDIRIIAATNRDLAAMMETGEFREDLYYRLNVIPIRVPALRERKEDILMLAEYFLRMYREMLEKNEILGFDGESSALLQAYDWPGNVRELQNAVEYAVNKCSGNQITLEDIPGRIREHFKPGTEPVPLKQMEKEAILNALAWFGNTPAGKEAAAEAMGISRATMYRKLKEYELE
ncbi:sigma 54-interacting transcriptional regulator [Anaerovoracaceae bacterium 42-11]